MAKCLFVFCTYPVDTELYNNTELSERLHMELAKESYRASNKVNFFVQMVIWLT